jgi:hypothetical protein
MIFEFIEMILAIKLRNKTFVWHKRGFYSNRLILPHNAKSAQNFKEYGRLWFYESEQFCNQSHCVG